MIMTASHSATNIASAKSCDSSTTKTWN